MLRLFHGFAERAGLVEVIVQCCIRPRFAVIGLVENSESGVRGSFAQSSSRPPNRLSIRLELSQPFLPLR